ncbi:pre-B-cell leukemia transcription factor-interacting protein 1 [Anolis carolinensis]|uniref:pre-B-cell leukemia transcription factor-interacting protein 1 n=1 Tax=Anolis carolinensis TaxID=28377 RepID=UPI002F2B17FF
MADNSDSRESDNNSSWVMAGSEALPVEDLRSEEAAEAQPEDPSPTERQTAPIDEKEVPEVASEVEEPKPKPPASGPGVSLDVPSEETPGASEPSPAPAPPKATDSPSHHAEEGSAAAPPEAPAFRKAGPAEDVEGLRRRKGREAPEVAAAAAAAAGGARVPGGAREEGGQAIWLCGFLALLALGLLVALGVVLDNGDGPEDILTTRSSSDQNDLEAGREGKAWSAPEPPAEAGLPVAKEEGLPPHLGAPRDPPSLEAMGALLDKMAKENQDIRLMQAELQAQKEELESLLRKTAGEAQASAGQQQSLEAENARLKEALRREASSLQAARDEVRLLREAKGAQAEPVPGPQPRPEPPEAEARRLRSVLVSLGHDLAKATARGGPGRSELSALRQKVAQAVGRGPAWQEGPKGKRGKEKPRKEARKPPGRKAKKPPPPPREPPALWHALATHPFGPPRGCAGVPECARREGLSPVPKAAFLQAAQGFLSDRGWGRHLAGLAGATQGFFGPDGLFAHHRLRFLDMLDEAEDALEELARGLGGRPEEADDFEETVLWHLGRVTPRSSGNGHHPAKDRGREGAGRRNGHEDASRAFGQH